MNKKPLLVPKRTMVSADFGYGVCLWRFPDGTYIQDAQHNYLCAQAKLNDPGTEAKMRKAAAAMGYDKGDIFWMPGFRSISDMEWEDQMAELLEGGVPDSVDVYRQQQNGGF